MITLLELAAEVGRDPTSVRRRAKQYGVPMFKTINPGSHQWVLALDAAAAKQLRALYPTKLTTSPVATKEVA